MTWRESASRLHATLAPAKWGLMERQRYLTLALCGEAGELANVMAKRWWRDDVPLERVAEELADVLIYAHLLAEALGLNAESICQAKTAANEAKFSRHGGADSHHQAGTDRR